jgi:hypothetical protein
MVKYSKVKIVTGSNSYDKYKNLKFKEKNNKISYGFMDGLRIKIIVEDTKHGMKYQKEQFISEDQLNAMNNASLIVKLNLEEASEYIFKMIEPTLSKFK